MTQFVPRNDGGNTSISAKLTTETVTSARGSPFAAPTGRLGQRAHLVTYKQLRGFIFHLVFIQDPLAQLCPAFYLERLARSPPLLLILLINFCICWVLFLPSFLPSRLSLLVRRGAKFSFLCTGFSLWSLCLLQNMGSRAQAQ